jgi:hypothetical protein
MSLGAVWVRAGVASSSTAIAESGIKYIRRFTRSLLPILPTSSQIVTKRKGLEKASKDPNLLGLGAIYVMLRLDDALLIDILSHDPGAFV